MKDRIKDTLLGFIIGDALGTPFDGMTGGHIHSSFKGIHGYTDPAPALKGKMERWRMPGLYSSISQMMILLSFHLGAHRRFDGNEFISFVKSIPDISENEYGIFRHPAQMEKSFLKRIIEESGENIAAVYSYPCARPAAILIPAALFSRESDSYQNIFAACKMFNSDFLSIAGPLIFSRIINSIVENKNTQPEKLIINSIDIIESLFAEIKNNTSKITGAGINPDALTKAAAEYKIILSALQSCPDIDSAEKKICAQVNKNLKTPVTRATVNHPLAIIPFALFLTAYNADDPGSALFSAAGEGGSSSVLCAVSGALAGALHGCDALPEILADNLVNKKRITAIIDHLTEGKLNQAVINDFISSEASLTGKEAEELKAKLKHQKIKIKTKKTRKDKEKELTRHVVESWTKMDQARWRKKLGRERDAGE